MKNLFFLASFLMFVSCKKEEILLTENLPIETKSKETIKEQNDTLAYFDQALTYRFEINGITEELWFYVNEQTQQVLYVPNDDMIQAVISYPDGKYVIFATDEHGQKVRLEQQINAVVSSEIEDKLLAPLEEKIIISQKNVQQKDLICSGYILKYLKMEGSEILFATTQIPINSFQVYGFSRLDGDGRIPINLDFINVFQKKQLITHIDREDFQLQLLNYGPNTYEFHLKSYLKS
ncbi:hypothetical protein [Flavobacterium sp.]|uniref:hypothetical protein n=1 Tax=Flavobacterium sp. TaxID=239 RepID=UPI002B4AE406|nr:hypothetical protein [Flavobacterium sp.]HLP63247.1 hypothetical protein [Flavobacterium sp.]